MVNRDSLISSACVGNKSESVLGWVRAIAALAMAVPVALAFRPVTANATTYAVDTLDDSSGNGDCSLRDAINAASGNPTSGSTCATAGSGTDTINFKVTGTINLGSTLPQVIKNLTILGPALPGITIDGGGNVQVMQVASFATVDLSNLVIANGFSAETGGGVYNNALGTLTVTNCTFSGNSAPTPVFVGAGGAIFNDDNATLTVVNSTFSLNSSFTGGAIYNAGKLTVTSSTFSGNNAPFDAGGAIFTGNNSTLTVTNSTFSGNSSEGGGGAIDNYLGKVTVTNSVFSSNTAPGNDGGAIANFDGRLVVTNSTFSANGGASAIGGAIYSRAEAPTPGITVTNTTFSGNSAIAGGGVFIDLGPATIINSTFSSNTAGKRAGDFGGGILNGGTLTVTNSTFSGNSALAGGGIHNSSVASVKNTILTSKGGGNCSGTITDAGYNISDDTTCGFTKTGLADNGDGVNPLLSTAGLAKNGGPTQTIAVQSSSPAIDAIPLANCADQALQPNPIITDQRLFPRPDISEVTCDIGAFEVQDTAFVPFSTFGGGLRIDPDAGVFYLSGVFKLGSGGSIDPTMEPVAFSVGTDAVRLPAGSFVKYSTGYVYQKTVNGIFLCIFIKFTNTPGRYQLLANRSGGTLDSSTSPVPVTLTIGNDSGSTQMNAKFY